MTRLKLAITADVTACSMTDQHTVGAPRFAVEALAANKPKLFTLVIPSDLNGSVLLGQKKRGFGTGFWNGFGGKVEAGETILQAAARELEEEACITATHLEAVGILTFVFDDNVQPWEVHVFRCEAYDGTPAETEEMRPQWFQQEDIPYPHMWADDVHWYPLFLSKHMFSGLFVFRNTTQLCWHQLQRVEQVQQAVWWRAAAVDRSTKA